jgi:hypothetical protein
MLHKPKGLEGGCRWIVGGGGRRDRDQTYHFQLGADLANEGDGCAVQACWGRGNLKCRSSLVEGKGTRVRNTALHYNKNDELQTHKHQTTRHNTTRDNTNHHNTTQHNTTNHNTNPQNQNLKNQSATKIKGQLFEVPTGQLSKKHWTNMRTELYTTESLQHLPQLNFQKHMPMLFACNSGCAFSFFPTLCLGGAVLVGGRWIHNFRFRFSHCKLLCF